MGRHFGSGLQPSGVGWWGYKGLRPSLVWGAPLALDLRSLAALGWVGLRLGQEQIQGFLHFAALRSK